MKTIWDKDTGLMVSHNEGRRSFFPKLFAGMFAVRVLSIPDYEEPELPEETEQAASTAFGPVELDYKTSSSYGWTAHLFESKVE